MRARVPESIYVAQGRSGLLKAGRTSDSKKRRGMLLKEFRRKGDVLVRFHSSPVGLYGYRAENELLRSLAERLSIHSGREWFFGRSFDNAMRAVDELGEHFASLPAPGLQPWEEDPEAWAALCTKRRAQREAEKAARKARRAAFFVGLEARRRIREFRATVLERVALQLIATPDPADQKAAA